jgi:hypothetical protein
MEKPASCAGLVMGYDSSRVFGVPIMFVGCQDCERRWNADWTKPKIAPPSFADSWTHCPNRISKENQS